MSRRRLRRRPRSQAVRACHSLRARRCGAAISRTKLAANDARAQTNVARCAEHLATRLAKYRCAKTFERRICASQRRAGDSQRRARRCLPRAAVNSLAINYWRHSICDNKSNEPPVRAAGRRATFGKLLSASYLCAASERASAACCPHVSLARGEARRGRNWLDNCVLPASWSWSWSWWLRRLSNISGACQCKKSARPFC